MAPSVVRRLVTFVFLYAATVVLVRAETKETVLYVSPSVAQNKFNNQPQGTYFSISAAITRASEIAARTGLGAKILLLPGTHNLRTPLSFASNARKWPFTPNEPLVIDSADPEQFAVLSGGVELSQWQVGASAWLWTSQLPPGADLGQTSHPSQLPFTLHHSNSNVHSASQASIAKTFPRFGSTVRVAESRTPPPSSTATSRPTA